MICLNDKYIGYVERKLGPSNSEVEKVRKDDDRLYVEYIDRGNKYEKSFRIPRNDEVLWDRKEYNFKIKVDSAHMGKVLSDIEKNSGSFEPPRTEGAKAVIQGKAPVATFMNYASELSAFTGGKGMINLNFRGYDKCHNAEEVIEKRDYDKKSDPEYTSSSIFCAKGKGYTLAWDQAESEMHLL